MAVENNAQFINQLEPSYPRKRDLLKEGDDHLRLIKKVIQNTFPNFDSFLTITSSKLNKLDSVFVFDNNVTTLKTGLTIKSTDNFLDMNPDGVLNRPNRIVNLPDPREGKAGLNDPVTVNWLVESKMSNQMAWPIGSLFLSVSSVNPSESLGFGEWVAFGGGRCLIGTGVGFDGTETRKFENSSVIGGKYQHTLTATEVPKHDHGFKFEGKIKTAGKHYHPSSFTGAYQLSPTEHPVTDIRGIGPWETSPKKVTTGWGGEHTHDLEYSYTMEPSGGDKSHNITQPYITINMWRRVK